MQTKSPPPELEVVGSEGARRGAAGAPPAAHQPAPVVVKPLLSAGPGREEQNNASERNKGSETGMAAGSWAGAAGAPPSDQRMQGWLARATPQAAAH